MYFQTMPGERGKSFQRHKDANSEEISLTEIYSTRLIKEVREEKSVIINDELSMRGQVGSRCYPFDPMDRRLPLEHLQ